MQAGLWLWTLWPDAIMSKSQNTVELHALHLQMSKNKTKHVDVQWNIWLYDASQETSSSQPFKASVPPKMHLWAKKWHSQCYADSSMTIWTFKLIQSEVVLPFLLGTLVDFYFSDTCWYVILDLRALRSKMTDWQTNTWSHRWINKTVCQSQCKM